MPKLAKKDATGTPAAPAIVQALPPGIKSVTVNSERLPNGNTMVQVEVVPDTANTGGASIVSGTDIVLVLDASFSMYASAYRNLKIFDIVDQVVKFLNPFDKDGIDIYLHSLREAPFKHVGTVTTPGEVQQLLTDYVEISTARKLMGTKTVCAPVLRDIVARLKEEKKSANVFISVLTDGEFDDEAAVESSIVEFGKKYNTKEEPFGFKLHFTGFGNLQFKFLKDLDDALEAKYPGFIDCIDFDTATEIEVTVQQMVKEFQRAVICAGSNGTVSVKCDQKVIRVGDAKTNRYADGDFFSGYEVVPAILSLGFELAGTPTTASIELGYEAVNGAMSEFKIPVKLA
jgi:hypothetical protein